MVATATCCTAADASTPAQQTLHVCPYTLDMTYFSSTLWPQFQLTMRQSTLCLAHGSPPSGTKLEHSRCRED